MKILVVYYSRTDLTRRVALKLATALGADVEELIDTNKRAGALGYLMAGRDAIQKKLVRIEALRYNPADYDLVLIGTPTWAYTMACAVRTYLTSNGSAIKQVAFFATHDSDGGSQAIRQMADLVGQAPRAELVLTSKEAAQDNYAEKLQAFVAKLV